MTFKITPMRYAHTNGHTNCVYTENGDSIITCGSDGDIRTWSSIDDDDPTSRCLGEYILCVLQYDKRLLVATDLNVVQAYTFPDSNRDGTIFRFTAPATCIKTTKTYLAAGSEDTCLKILRQGNQEEEFELKGHEGPILHIDISVDDILASSSGDGTIKIWNLNEKSIIKTIPGLTKVKSFDSAKVFASPTFQPQSGKCLAYPKGKEIILLNTQSWELQDVLTDDNISTDYSMCSFSCCGQYMAAGTQNGDISVWNLSTKRLIQGETATKESQGITAIAWNPKNNREFAYCDSTGQLGTIIFNDKYTTDNNDLVEDAEESGEDNIYEMQLEDNVEDEDNENCVSLERLKHDTMKTIRHEDDAIDDDVDDDKSSKSVTVGREVIKSYTQQKAFQPGSTPKNLEHRYLVWNDIGIVRAYTSDTDGTIDVEFHDVHTHHALHMNNYLQHTMASLSSAVLALSSESSSKLVCITLSSAGSREWSIELPDCEGILALTATNKYVAVGTDNRFVRIFTVMGTQREILSIPGPIVALSGSEDKIMVAYHRSPASEDQHISMMLYQIFGLSIRCREIPVPILPGKKLSWIGYSDCGSPISCDTMGLVQMYSPKTNCWYPICDTMKHTQNISNNFFVINVSEKNQLIHAVLCRGSSYPMTNPRPMVTELPMQLPLCEIDSEKSTLEESLMRWSNFSVQNSDKMIKEAAIKLFALACRVEMEARAKELIEMIASPQLLPLAVKYASKLGRIHLADKLSELLPQLEEQEKEREVEMQNMEVQMVNALQNSPLNASLLLLQRSKAVVTPHIAPKPMVISHQKRNPFKRSNVTTPTEIKNNPLSHLTDKAIGYETKEYQDDGVSLLSDETNHVEAHGLPSVNNENLPTNENNSSMQPNFMSWFKQNKEDLLINYPDVSPAELTKIGMKQYKSLSNKSSSEDHIRNKRKLEEHDSGKSSTGGSKLKKFAFAK